MTLDTLTAIAIIGGAIALAVIGLALRAMRQERDRQASADEPATAEVAPGPPPEPAEAPPPAPAEQPEPPPKPAEAAPPPDETVEVLRVLRAAPQGPLLVEMDGQRYHTVNEIKDQKHGLDLVDAIMDLQQFLGLDIVASLSAEGHASPEPEAGKPAAGPEPLQRPSLNPIRQMMILRDRELKKAREKREAGPQPASIVEEIEAILVKRLAGSPFEGRSIHMRPGLHGGAHIDVDGRAYESIEDVADLEVKQFLKSVIAEWEAGR